VYTKTLKKWKIRRQTILFAPGYKHNYYIYVKYYLNGGAEKGSDGFDGASNDTTNAHCSYSTRCIIYVIPNTANERIYYTVTNWNC
jgi:hypothetical protein